MENPTDNDDLHAHVKAHRYDQIRQENGDECNVQEGGSDEYTDDGEYFNVIRHGNTNPSTLKHSSSTIHYQDVSHTAGSAKVNHSDNIEAVPASHMSNENPVSISTNAITVSSASAQNQILISDAVTSPTQTTASIASMQGTLSETPTINEQRLENKNKFVATTIANTTQNGILENGSVIIVENPQSSQYYLVTVGAPVTETALDTSTPSTSKTRKRRCDQPKFDDPVKEKKRLDAKTRAQKHRDKSKLEKQQTHEELKRIREEKEESQTEVKRLKTENQALNHKNQALNLENEALDHKNQALNLENEALDHKNQALNLENEALDRKNQALNHKNQALDHKNQALDHKNQALDIKNLALNLENEALNLENEALKFENEKGKEEIQNQKIETAREIQNLKLEKVELERKVQILTSQNALGLLNEEHLSLIDFDIINDLL